MSFRVEITETAYRDLDQILSWLSERSPDAAARLSTQFDKALSRLESFPLSSGLAHENPLVGEELRHLLFGIQIIAGRSTPRFGSVESHHGVTHNVGNDCDPRASAGRLPRRSITPVRGPGCEENFAMIPSAASCSRQRDCPWVA